MIKTLILVFAVAPLLADSSALSQAKSRLYLMCNHTAHEKGKWVRVDGGPWDKIPPCDEAAKVHKSNHGISKKTWNVQCSWRTKAP